MHMADALISPQVSGIMFVATAGILTMASILLIQALFFADGLTKEILSNKELMNSSSLELPLCLQNCPVCHSKRQLHNFAPT